MNADRSVNDNEDGANATSWSATVNSRVVAPVGNGPVSIFLVDEQKPHSTRRLAHNYQGVSWDHLNTSIRARRITPEGGSPKFRRLVAASQFSFACGMVS